MDIIVAGYGFSSIVVAILLSLEGNNNVKFFDMGSGIANLDNESDFPSGLASTCRLLPASLKCDSFNSGFDKVVEDIPYQIVLPSHRLNVYRDKNLFMEELRREFPDELRSITSFFEKIEDIRHALKCLDSLNIRESFVNFKAGVGSFYKGINSLFTLGEAFSSSVADELNKNSHNKEFGIFIDVQTRFFLQQSIENTALILYSLFYDVLLQGFKRCFGSRKDLFRTINKYIGDSNGKFEMSSGENINKSHFQRLMAISDCTVADWVHPWVYEYLETNFGIRDNYFDKIGAERGSFILWGLNFAVSAKVIPENLASDVIICSNEHLPLIGTNVVYLSFSKVPNTVQRGMITGSANALFPKLLAHRIANNVYYRDKLLKEIIKSIKNIIPFWDEGNPEYMPTRVYYVNKCKSKVNLYKFTGKFFPAFFKKDYARYLKFRNIFLIGDLFTGWMVPPVTINLGKQVVNKICKK